MSPNTTPSAPIVKTETLLRAKCGCVAGGKSVAIDPNLEEYRRLKNSFAFEVPLREIEERLPIRGNRRVAAAVVVERQAPSGDRLVEFRNLRDAQVLGAEKSVDRPGGGQGEKFSLGIAPLIGQTAVDIREGTDVSG